MLNMWKCENVKWCSCYRKQYAAPQKIKNRLPYDPGILLLGVHLKKLKKEIQTYL